MKIFLAALVALVLLASPAGATHNCDTPVQVLENLQGGAPETYILGDYATAAEIDRLYANGFPPPRVEARIVAFASPARTGVLIFGYNDSGCIIYNISIPRELFNTFTGGRDA